MDRVLESGTLVIGGGVVGAAITYGMAAAGERVTLLDEGDEAFRAARGNFGLVWASGKGLGYPDYARWSRRAVHAWPEFARELESLTGIELELSQVGGLTMYLDERELAQRARDLEGIRAAIGDPYSFEVLDLRGVRELEPFAGPEVAGAIFSPLDGHVSPLRLLRSLAKAIRLRGGKVETDARCERIEYRAREFHVAAGGRTHVAGRVVLAAGLGNRALAPQVGLRAPIRPNRGQVIITERVRPFLRHPSQSVRQTGEGTVQIGDTHEDVDMDDATAVPQLARMADQASRYFPILAGVNVVRTWGALRILTPDGFPVYQASSECPGAFIATCHSGISLAALHATAIADWVRGGIEPAELGSFRAERFHA
jgi:glycine/D-amino acid oxidase-like deaminating enzyme